MVGYGLDRGGPKDSETAPNSFLTKINKKGLWQFGTDISKLIQGDQKQSNMRWLKDTR